MRSVPRSLAALALALATVAGGATAASAASGSGGGGTGGGGTGGGGGGGGGGATVGAISRVSAGATCDAGTTIGVTLDKGFNKRVNVSLVMNTAAAGRWEIHVDNTTNGTPIMGMATDLPQSPSIGLQSLGGTVPIGTSEVSFRATRRDFGSLLEPGSPLAPLAETCTASLVVVGR